MEKLIKKLEAANGGSYYLDKEISEQREPGAMCFPNYTRSIDGAKVLVPEGYNWTLDVFPDGKACSSVYCEDGGNSGLTDGATPALAICIAALKA